MTRSKVIGGQIVIVILVLNLFQILFEQVRFNYNQAWIIIGTIKVHNGNLHVMMLFEVK